MKSLKNLGKALTKAEQKEVFGGSLVFNRHECDPGSGSGNYMSPACQCLSQGKIWNSECSRCEVPNQHYFDDGNCGQLFWNS